MNMLTTVKNNTDKAIKEWKVINKKAWENCTIEELKKKLVHSKYITYSIILTLLLMLVKMFDLFFFQNTASITLNTVIVVGLVFGYAEATYRYMLQIYIEQRKNYERISKAISEAFAKRDEPCPYKRND